MKSICAIIVAWVIASSTPTAAFENIEADAVYDRSIKEAIKVEYERALIALKAQADALKMTVRDKNIKAIKQHMFDEAFMMGRCFDRTLTRKKTSGKNIDWTKDTKACVEEHLKYMSESKNNLPFKCSLLAAVANLKPPHERNLPYEFLEIKGAVPNVTDYVGMKECHDGCRAILKEKNTNDTRFRTECSFRSPTE